MADIAKTVSVIFQGEDRNLTALTGKIDRDAQSLSKSFEFANQAVISIGKLDLALGTLAAGGLYYALKKSIEFENAVVEMRKVAGDAPKDIDMASEAAINLSETYGESASNILMSTADFIQAGFNTKEAMDLTKSSMDLVIAGSVGAADASNYLITILKGFKAPASEVTRVVDILNEVSNKYATDVQQLAIGMADLSPIAKTMGFDFEETAGLLTPVIEVFMSGSEAAMGLKTGLLKLVDDSAPVRDALASIGVSQRDANGEMRSGKDILHDVMIAFQGLSEPQKLYVTQQLVGIEQSARMVEVFNQMNKVMEVTQVAYSSTGSAAKEVEARLKSTEVQVKILKESFNNLAVTIGNEFKSSLVEVAQGGAEMTKALRQIAEDKTFEPLFKAFSDMVDGIGETLKEGAKNLPEAFEKVDWSKLVNSMREVGRTIGVIFNVDTSNPEDLARAIQRVVDSTASWIDVNRGLIAGLAPFGNAILKIIDGFNALDSDTKAALAQITSIAAAYRMFGPVVGTAMLLIGQDSEGMAQIVKVAFLAIENGANVLLTALVGIAYGFARAYRGALELLDLVPGMNMSAEIRDASTTVNDLESLLSKSFDRLAESSQKTSDAIFGIESAQDNAKGSTDQYASAMSVATEMAAKYDRDIKGLSETLDESSKPRTIDLQVHADKKQIADTWGMVTEILPDGSTLVTNIGLKTDQDNLDATKKKVDEVAPEKKEAEIQLKMDMEKIKEQSQIVQKAIEWKAKVDIADIEAQAEKMKVIFTTLGDEFKASADVSISMANILKDMNSSSQSWDVLKLMDREMSIRESLVESQKKMLEAQADEMKARTEMYRKGEGIIKIDGTGLAPHLEALMFEILSAIQIRANQEGAEFLVGIT